MSATVSEELEAAKRELAEHKRATEKEVQRLRQALAAEQQRSAATAAVLEEREKELGSVRGDLEVSKGIVSVMRKWHSVPGKSLWQDVDAASRSTCLDLQCQSRISDASLGHESTMTHLVSINLERSSGFSAVGIRRLYHLPLLRKLNLQKSKLSDQALVGIGAARSIEHLILNDTGVTNDGLLHLTGSASLQRLELNGCSRVTSAGMVHVGRVIGLQELDIQGTGVTDDGLQHLTSLSKLNGVKLPGVVTSDAMMHVRRLTALKQLDLSGTKVTDGGMQHLTSLTRLKRLKLPGVLSGAALVYVGRLTRLQILDFELCRQHTLERLKREFQVKRQVAAYPGPRSKHDHAEQEGSSSVQEKGYQQQLPTPLANLQKLIIATEGGRSGVQYLTSLCRLQALKLLYAAGDADLEHVRSLTALQAIDLQYTQVTAQGLRRHLTSLGKLRSVFVPSRVTKAEHFTIVRTESSIMFVPLDESHAAEWERVSGSCLAALRQSGWKTEEEVAAAVQGEMEIESSLLRDVVSMCKDWKPEELYFEAPRGKTRTKKVVGSLEAPEQRSSMGEERLAEKLARKGICERRMKVLRSVKHGLVKSIRCRVAGEVSEGKREREEEEREDVNKGGADLKRDERVGREEGLGENVGRLKGMGGVSGGRWGEDTNGNGEGKGNEKYWEGGVSREEGKGVSSGSLDNRLQKNFDSESIMEAKRAVLQEMRARPGESHTLPGSAVRLAAAAIIFAL